MFVPVTLQEFLAERSVGLAGAERVPSVAVMEFLRDVCSAVTCTAGSHARLFNRGAAVKLHLKSAIM